MTNVSITVPTLSSPYYVTQWHKFASYIRHLLQHPRSPSVRCFHHRSGNSVHHICSRSEKWLGTVPPLIFITFCLPVKSVSIKVPTFFHLTWSPTDKLHQHSPDTFFTTLGLPVRNNSNTVSALSSRLLLLVTDVSIAVLTVLHHIWTASDESVHHECGTFNSSHFIWQDQESPSQFWCLPWKPSFLIVTQGTGRANKCLCQYCVHRWNHVPWGRLSF